MEFKSLALTLALLSSFHISLSRDIECVYHDNGDWWVLSSFYYCSVENHLNILSPEDSVVENATGKHLKKKTLDDVEGFEAHNLTIHYFPKGLEKIFKNLKMIDINYGRMREIHQSDLRNFPQLKCLEMEENDIEVLEGGLFQFNPLLEMIWLTNNKIIHVDSNLFSNLGQLTYLSLDANRCIAEYAENNATAVANIIKRAEKNCRDFVHLEKTFPDFMDAFRALQDDVKQLNEKLQNVSGIEMSFLKDKSQDHSENLNFFKAITLVIVGLAIGLVGLLGYQKYFSYKYTANSQVSFENHDYK